MAVAVANQSPSMVKLEPEHECAMMIRCRLAVLSMGTTRRHSVVRCAPKVYCTKPAQMLASYRVLATTALRDSVMQVRTDFDAVWGHVGGKTA